MIKGLVIAIDGPAASGKSTTARRVARHFGYTYVDSGAMYRAATLAVLREGIDPGDRALVEESVNRHSIRLESAEGGAVRVLLDDADVSHDIRTHDVTANVSTISAYPGVRTALVRLQREMGGSGGVVMDGRDIGTAVFPHADLKVFMIADLHARAIRRFDELNAIGEPERSVTSIQTQLSERDRLDSTRAQSPLEMADDAVLLDTSNLTIDQQVAEVIRMAEEILRSGRAGDGGAAEVQS